MKIKKMEIIRGNDFFATMECEHCGHSFELTSGYDDWNYHTNVIPAMYCGSCGRNRAGITDFDRRALKIIERAGLVECTVDYGTHIHFLVNNDRPNEAA